MNNRISSTALVIIPLFTTLTIVGTFIKIPTPIVPITLQTFFVLLSGALLGARYGAASQGLYIMLGLIGIPVFTYGGGLSYVLHPTFGYIIGFVFASMITGYIVEKQSHNHWFNYYIAMLVGLAALYSIGVVYLYFILNYIVNMPITFLQALITGVLIPAPKDLFTTALAAMLVCKIKRYIPILRTNGGNNDA